MFDFITGNKALWEMVKEGLRLALFAGASALVSFALEKLGVMNQSEVSVVVGTMMLRMVDKWLHERAKLTKGWDGSANGLVKF